MTDTKRCHECDEVRPITEFRRNPHAASGRVGLCEDCHNYQGNRGKRSYVDHDAKESTPPMSSDRLARLHGLSLRERRIAGLAAAKVIDYRCRDRSRVGPLGWQGESAVDVVDEKMPNASARKKYHVLTTAMAKAYEMVGEARDDAA